jgi:N-acetylmuramoyl-L-alanine amidase
LKRKQIPLFLLLFWPCFSFAQKKDNKQTVAIQYLTFTADAGETVADLLERYALEDYDCNETQFYAINHLKKGATLKAGKEYLLPIQIVEYNGKSIRTTLDIEDWRVAKRIETFNRESQKRRLRDDDFVFSTNLWVPWHSLHCADDKNKEPEPEKKKAPAAAARINPKKLAKIAQEPTKGERTYPIYGSASAKTRLLSQQLKNRVFYIVAGHGGPDVGAQGTRSGRTLCEDEYAYDVALRLHRLLIAHGAYAYMIVRDPNDGIRDGAFLDCDKDEVVWTKKEIPLVQKERLQQRCDVINNFTEQYLEAGIADQTFIEIHVDSRSQHARTDVFFYYRPESEESKALARRTQNVFVQKYRQLQGGRQFEGSVTPRYLYMLRETIVPKAIYVELGNIKNDWDQQRLVIRNNRQALANWLFEGIK